MTAAFGSRRGIDQQAPGKPYDVNLARWAERFAAHSPGADLVCYREMPPGCPPHEDMPYAFKPYAVRDIRDRGYDEAIWADVALYPVRGLADAWDIVGRDGYLLLRSDHNCGEWTCDAALGPLEITREQAFGMPQMVAAFWGLNFRADAGNRFLDEFVRLAGTGCFRGTWQNLNGEASPDRRVQGHRFEQTAASVVAAKMGLRLHRQEPWISYYTEGDAPLALVY